MNPASLDIPMPWAWLEETQLGQQRRPWRGCLVELEILGAGTGLEESTEDGATRESPRGQAHGQKQELLRAVLGRLWQREVPMRGDLMVRSPAGPHRSTHPLKCI